MGFCKCFVIGVSNNWTETVKDFKGIYFTYRLRYVYLVHIQFQHCSLMEWVHRMTPCMLG